MANSIDITKLEKNTKILLETEETVFEILVLEPKECKIIVHGGTKFLKPKGAVIKNMDQSDGSATEFMIVKGCCMVFAYEEGKIENRLITSKVVSANLYGVDNSWTYEAIKK